MQDSSAPDQNAESAGHSNNHAGDLEQLRERLAFYESFDQLIHDNISRAGDLLREAAARKSEGDLAIRTTTAEFEQKQLTERMNYRRIFSGLLDEVTTVQQNVERLARQVSDALDDLEATIPAAGEDAGLEGHDFPAMPTFNAASAAELAAGHRDVEGDQSDREREYPAEAFPSGEEQTSTPIADVSTQFSDKHAHEHSFEPVDELVTPDEAQYDPTLIDDSASVSPGVGVTPAFTSAVQASVERISQTVAGTESHLDMDEQSEGPQAADVSVELQSDIAEASAPVESESQAVTHETETDGDDWIDAGSAATTTLLIHGVPRATTALSLKRYLEGLAQVHSVEPREYAEGTLRLQVLSDRPVMLNDLQGWTDVQILEPMSVSDDFLEVRLGQ